MELKLHERNINDSYRTEAIFFLNRTGTSQRIRLQPFNLIKKSFRNLVIPFGKKICEFL